MDNILNYLPKYDPDSPYIDVPVVDLYPNVSLPAVGFIGGEQLRLSKVQAKPWLWHGYVAKGSMTLLTSLWKSGKTTLVCHLLQAVRRGETTFLGQRLDARKMLVVSEEGDFLWAERARRFDYSNDLQFAMRPFVGKPDLSLWQQFLDQVLKLCRQHDIAFVVIDPLANFIPGDENDATSMQNFLSPMQKLTTADIGVLLLHHPRKRGGSEGTASRGSGALTAFVDVILEMKRPIGDATSRARIIEGYSRFQETPTELTVEMDEGGTGYRVVANADELRREAIARTAYEIIRESGGTMVVDEIIQSWPEGKTPPSAPTLRKCLKGLMHSFLGVEGTGASKNPHRYKVVDANLHP